MSLANKYRPRTWQDLIGQEHVVKQIIPRLSKEMPSSIILTGLFGCGKTTIARLLATTLNCPNVKENNPCGTCPSCQSIFNGSATLAVQEMDAASNGGIDNVRELISELKFGFEGFKVIIIDEAHGLSSSAWDAFLKIIENPPKNVLFIFSTNEPQKIKKTVASRCIKLQLKSVSLKDISILLTNISTKEQLKITKEVIEEIAKLSGGSVREAVSILDGVSSTGEISLDSLKDIFQTLSVQDCINYFSLINKKEYEKAHKYSIGWLQAGLNPERVINALIEFLTASMFTYILGERGWSKDEVASVTSFKNTVGATRLYEWLEILEDSLNTKIYGTYTLILDLLAVKLMKQKEVISTPIVQSNMNTPKYEYVPTTIAVEPLPMVKFTTTETLTKPNVQEPTLEFVNLCKSWCNEFGCDLSPWDGSSGDFLFSIKNDKKIIFTTYIEYLPDFSNSLRKNEICIISPVLQQMLSDEEASVKSYIEKDLIKVGIK